MSVATEEPLYTCERSGCLTEYPLHEARRGYFCSDYCYFKSKGDGVLAQAERTSQFCNTCYGQVRDVEPVPESKKAGKGYSLDGYQYQTPNTVVGFDDFAEHPHDRLERTRWSCRCGAVDPNRTTAELQNVDLPAVITNLYRALAWLAERDAIADAPDWDAYAEAIRERPRDAAYACGRSVYG